MDDTQWDGTLPNFRGSLAIRLRSYPTGESRLPHPTNVLRIKHLRNGEDDFQLIVTGTKSGGLQRNEIEEGTVPFSLCRGGRKEMRSLSSGEGMFGKQVESA
jgi:hypothetical protein